MSRTPTGAPPGHRCRPPLIASINAQISADPYWPTLAERLSTADRAGIDIAALTRTAAAAGPLPDEQPAAALWWRLAEHLTPATVSATATAGVDTLRPAWTPLLEVILGVPAAQQVIADPAWPALVAAVSIATKPVRRGTWHAEAVLSTAYDMLRAAQPDDAPLRPAELATALAWRIGILTDPNHTTSPAPDVADRRPDQVAPTSGIGEPAQVLLDTDEDWLASLTEPEYEEPDYERAEYDQPGYDGPAETVPSAQADQVGDVDAAAYERNGRLLKGLLGRDPAADAARRRADEPQQNSVTGIVSRDRILELNRFAGEFFRAHYTDSWAPGYVAGRLGSDLSGDARFIVGYAPGGWTALTDHLRAGGASDTEIVAAGLGSYAATGRVIDRFRDRLVFAIQHGEDPEHCEIRGWIGRRNPATNDADIAGPKYLNTAQTEVFSKGREMFGRAEGAAALVTGATPVLVEGPMDGIAVTLAGGGDYVGVAPLGTALTDDQADLLRPFIGTGKAGVIVATDADRAGQQAAHRAFWQLTARGDNPRHLVLPGSKDPAELLQTSGPAALHAALSQAGSLADSVITARIGVHADRLDTVEGRVFSARQAAQVIAALPPDSWTHHLEQVIAATGVAPETAMKELLDAAQDWADDPRGFVTRHSDATMPPPTHTPAGSTAAAPSTPAQRRAQLADSVAPQLRDDPYWPTLAAAIDRAATAGYDVITALPALIAAAPLPDEHVARTVHYRLANNCPDAQIPEYQRLRDAARGLDETTAANRIATGAHRRGHEQKRVGAQAKTRAPRAPDSAGAPGNDTKPASRTTRR